MQSSVHLKWIFYFQANFNVRLPFGTTTQKIDLHEKSLLMMKQGKENHLQSHKIVVQQLAC
jgi:hypothetical protein